MVPLWALLLTSLLGPFLGLAAAVAAAAMPIRQTWLSERFGRRHRSEMAAADFASRTAEALHAAHAAQGEVGAGGALPTDTNAKVGDASSRLALVEFYFDESVASAGSGPRGSTGSSKRLDRR